MEPENYQSAPASTPEQAPAHEGSVGPVVATVIILAVIILGGLYFWAQRGSTPEAPYENTASEITPPATVSTTDNTTTVIESQSRADDLTSIEADLENTETTSLDSGLN